MFDTRFWQRPSSAAGPSLERVQTPAGQMRRQRMRWINRVSTSMLATVVSAMLMLFERASGGSSPWLQTLGLLALWLVLFLGLGLLARVTARLAMRLVDAWRRQPDAVDATDHAVYARTLRDPALAREVEALLQTGETRKDDDELPAIFTAPRYCRYL